MPFHYQQFGFRRASRKPIEIDWRAYIELFTYRKELLQHLSTGHNDFYALIYKNEGKFDDFEVFVIRVFFYLNINRVHHFENGYK